MTNFKTIDQERTSTAIDGVAYGRNIRILARVGNKLLIWVPGQSVWAGTGQPWIYAPSGLYVHYQTRGGTKIGGGGRLTVTRLGLFARQIDDRFGDGFWRLLDPNKTVVVGE